MCYKTAGPPDRVDYVCPRCGERTVYARGGAASEGVRAASWEMSELVGRRLEECRRQVLGIRDHGVSLDETEFCGKCRPDVREPRLALVVRLTGEEGERRTAGVSPEDVAVVAEFLEGKDRHDAGRDREEPLKDHAKRIAELLGLE
jgi:hypothetical protein